MRGKEIDCAEYTKEMNDFAAEARARWGGTDAFRAFEQKTGNLSAGELRSAGEGLTAVFAGFGALRQKTASDPEAQAQVRLLQEYITAHFYPCTNEILSGLGRLYVSDSAFAENIDRAGGEGTAAFAAEAIRVYCG